VIEIKETLPAAPAKGSALMLAKLIDGIVNPKPPRFHGVMGIYYYVDDAADAVKALRQAGHKNLNVFSPVPHHEIERARSSRVSSLVRWVTAVGGLLGATGGFGLCFYSIASWPLVIGGKELVLGAAHDDPRLRVDDPDRRPLEPARNVRARAAAADEGPLRRTTCAFRRTRIGIWVPCGPRRRRASRRR